MAPLAGPGERAYHANGKVLAAKVSGTPRKEGGHSRERTGGAVQDPGLKDYVGSPLPFLSSPQPGALQDAACCCLRLLPSTCLCACLCVAVCLCLCLRLAVVCVTYADHANV